MIIVVSPSFEDHCAGNKDPETDGGPSEQTHNWKGLSIKVWAFLWGWAVMLVSPCLSSGKQSENSQSHITQTNTQKATPSVWGKVGWLESGIPNRLCNLCSPQPGCMSILVLNTVLSLSSIAFWHLHLWRTAQLGTHKLLQSNMPVSMGDWRYLFKFCALLFGGFAVLSSWLIKV